MHAVAIKFCRSIVVLTALVSAPIAAQSRGQLAEPSRAASPAAAAASDLPSDYVIGVDDVLAIVFWREKDLSAEVVVRPDGKISIPMLNDVVAAGMTPEQLAENIEQIAAKYVRDPGATVMVREIRSRKIYIVGEVGKPGTFPLASQMTVLQAIAEAGGLLEHAKKDEVIIVRTVNGDEQRFTFNYNDVVRGKNTQQNIKLLPGDTILVR